MAIDSSKSFVPKAPVKPTVAKPHSPTTKPGHTDPNKPTNNELSKQDAQAQQTALDTFTNAGVPLLAAKALMTGTSLGTAALVAQIGTGLLQKEEGNKLSKTGDTRKVPPKLGQTASSLISEMVDKTLLLANNAGVTFIADLLQKGTDESKGLPLSAEQNRRLLDVKTTTPQAYRAGLEKYFASKVAQKLVGMFVGRGMDDEARLAADMVENFMPGRNL